MGATSRSLAVTSGVLQGSILGPLLFLPYENHLSKAVTKSKIATFADDTKIFRTIHSSFDASLLQNDLSSSEESHTKINLAVNVTKCKVLRVTRKENKIIYPYKLYNTILESTDCERDLGVLTSSNLTWTKHVDLQCTRATRMLGYVRRSTLNIQSMDVRLMLYLTLVRSQLCYGCQVWAPQSVTMTKCTERVQRRAKEFPFRTDTSYKQRHLLLNLLPLCYWHEFLDMVLYFKLIHGIMNIDIQLLPSANSN